MVVGQLQLLSDVLLPGRVEGHQFWEEVGSHGSFNHVGVVEHFLVVVTFHPSAGSLHVLAVVQQNLVQLFVFVRDLLPVVNHSCPVENGAVGEHLRCWRDPSMSLPADVGEWVLDEPEEVLEASLLVALIDAFLAESELFKLPIILLSHRAKSRDKYR